MRRGLLPVVFLALLVPGSAGAGGVNLAWDQCWPEGGAAIKSFACDRDSGSQTLVGSFVLDTPLSDVGALGVVILGFSPGGELPAWWQLYNAGACRQSALSVSFDFSGAPSTGCQDPWGGQATGGIAAYRTTLFPPPSPLQAPRPNEFELKLGAFPAEPASLECCVEYYAFRLRITNARTVGAEACTGCGASVCMVLNEVFFQRAGDGSIWRSFNAQANNLAMWQTGDWWNCYVPARSRTWGSVKALYR